MGFKGRWFARWALLEPFISNLNTELHQCLVFVKCGLLFTIESFEPNSDHYNLVSKYFTFAIQLFDWRLVKWTLLLIHKHDGFNLIRIWTGLEYRIVQKLPMMKVPSPMLLTSMTITGCVSGWDLVHTYLCHKLNQWLVRFSASRSMCHSGLLSSGMLAQERPWRAFFFIKVCCVHWNWYFLWGK